VLTTTTSRGVRLVDNIALQNAKQNIVMRGSVVDTVTLASQTFMDTIYPNIGTINTIDNVILPNPKPVPLIGVPASVPGFLGNAVGGNMSDTIVDPN
jgi:hypothetical protein